MGHGIHFCDTTERASQRLTPQKRGRFPKVSQKWLDKPPDQPQPWSSPTFGSNPDVRFQRQKPTAGPSTELFEVYLGPTRSQLDQADPPPLRCPVDFHGNQKGHPLFGRLTLQGNPSQKRNTGHHWATGSQNGPSWELCSLKARDPRASRSGAQAKVVEVLAGTSMARAQPAETKPFDVGQKVTLRWTKVRVAPGR